MIATGTTLLAGIMGWPVAHSLSPRLHGYWIDRHGLDAAYLPLPVCPADFGSAVRGLMATGFRGVNVTIPHKQAAMCLCDTIGPAAARIGAVNTLVFADGLIRGDNTDGAGFLRGLLAGNVEPSQPALVLGAGGAARAIVVALQAAGAEVTIAARDDNAAFTLARELKPLKTLNWNRREHELTAFGLLVNTTPGGMTGMPALEMSLDHAPPRLAVADIVYAPRRTPLLERAAARGLVTVEGIEMLLHQAAPGFRAWFGVEPIVDAGLREFMTVA